MTGLAVDAAGDVYVAGTFESYSVAFGSAITLYNSGPTSEIFVAKLSGATGQWLWARRCGGTNHDLTPSVAINATGDVYLAGFSGSALADYGPHTLTATQYGYLFLAKLNAAGAWQWVRQTGTDGLPTLSNMVLDGQGNVYLAGTFNDGSSYGRSRSLSFGPTTLTARTPGTPTQFPSSSGSDLFLAKFTDAGAPVWAVQGEANGENMVTNYGLATDGAGHLYLAGAYGWTSARIGGTYLPNPGSLLSTPGAPIGQLTYASNAYLARVNAATGAWDWVIRTSGTQGGALMAVAADSQGRVCVIGELENPLSGAGQVHLGQLDGATGAWQWTLARRNALPYCLALDTAGRVTVGGFFSGATAAFGPVVLSQAGGAAGTTGYLARLGAGPLAARPAAAGPGALAVWPNPSPGRTVWVLGPPPGRAVLVLDALGRLVGTAAMPAAGPLALSLPAALPAGLYVVRCGTQARRLVVE